MQPYFFPYLGYFQLIHAVDRFVLYDELDFIKGGWVSRNRLLAVKGAPFFFIVPLVKKSSNKKIRDVRIEGGAWRRKLLSSIRMNYRKSPYFEEIYPVVEEVIGLETDSLAELNKVGIERVVSFVGIETELLLHPEFEGLEERLTRPAGELAAAFPSIRLNEAVAKVIRAIEICKALEADMFVNPVGGAEMYPKDEFRRNGIEVSFLQMKDVRYTQFCAGFDAPGEFRSGLSIIDVLMNCGQERTVELLDKFVLC